MNVAEPWILYDTVIISKNMYGKEISCPGWFTSFQGFAQQETHSFFKSRSEGIAGSAYNNQQSPDMMDYAFIAYSIGLTFFAPGVRLLGNLGALRTQILRCYSGAAHWWEVELPNHVGVQFKIQNDVVSEGPAYDYPPGYGPSGGGGAMEISNGTIPNISNLLTHTAFFNNAGTQGVPIFANRHIFKEPIEIPRTSLIEGVINLGAIARSICSLNLAPTIAGVAQFPDYIIPMVDATTAPGIADYKTAPARFGIQMSLLGKRLVQQRGQYHS